MLPQIKKLLQIKSCITRKATWKLVPSLPLVLRRIKMADDRSENGKSKYIKGYFHQGYQNDVILELLGVYHNIAISLSTFKASCVKLTSVYLSATELYGTFFD